MKEQEICTREVSVVGQRHSQLSYTSDEELDRLIATYQGRQLRLVHEDNAFDPYDYISVWDEDYVQVGCISRALNGRVHRLLGKEGAWFPVVRTGHLEMVLQLSGTHEELWEGPDVTIRSLEGSVLGAHVTAPFLPQEGRLLLMQHDMNRLLQEEEQGVGRLPEICRLLPRLCKLMNQSLCGEDEEFYARNMKRLEGLCSRLPEADARPLGEALTEVSEGRKEMGKKGHPAELFTKQLKAVETAAGQDDGFLPMYMAQHFHADPAPADIYKERAQVEAWLDGQLEGTLRGLAGNPTLLAQKVMYAHLDRKSLYLLYAHLTVLNRLREMLADSEQDIRVEQDPEAGHDRRAEIRLIQAQLKLLKGELNPLYAGGLPGLLQSVYNLLTGDHAGCEGLWRLLHNRRRCEVGPDGLVQATLLNLWGELLRRGYFCSTPTQLADRVTGRHDDTLRKQVSNGFSSPCYTTPVRKWLDLQLPAVKVRE